MVPLTWSNIDRRGRRASSQSASGVINTCYTVLNS